MATDDFKSLLDPMKLDEWEVSLVSAPALQPIAPFRKWRTGTLDWYTAYNDVKHFREGKFPEAKLEHVIDAVAAVYVMFRAQFGVWSGHSTERIPLSYYTHAHEVAAEGDEFRLVAEPRWSANEVYMPPTFVGQSSWTKRSRF